MSKDEEQQSDTEFVIDPAIKRIHEALRKAQAEEQ